MLKHITRQAGFAILGISLLASTAEIRSTYKMYVAHEAKKFTQIHEAYQKAFVTAYAQEINRGETGRTISHLAAAINIQQLQPPVTMQKINVKSAQKKVVKVRS